MRRSDVVNAKCHGHVDRIGTGIRVAQAGPWLDELADLLHKGRAAPDVGGEPRGAVVERGLHPRSRPGDREMSLPAS
jgi:hypothetical protein